LLSVTVLALYIYLPCGNPPSALFVAAEIFPWGNLSFPRDDVCCKRKPQRHPPKQRLFLPHPSGARGSSLLNKFHSSAEAASKRNKKSPLIWGDSDIPPPDLAEKYGPDRLIYLKICYTEHDIEEGDIVKSQFFWDSIIETTEEMFGYKTDDGSLEYYNGEDWFQLKPFRLYDVLKYYACTSDEPLPVRIPALYDEEYGTRNEAIKIKKVTPDMRKRQRELMKMGPSPHQWLLKETIDALLYRLKRDGYTLSEESTLQKPLLTLNYHAVSGEVRTADQRTRSYILEQARLAPWVRPPPDAPKPPPETPQEQMKMQKEEREQRVNPEKVLQHLKYVLLSHPRALRHIEECLHYEFMWTV
jgi:hypothetical protein